MLYTGLVTSFYSLYLILKIEHVQLSFNERLFGLKNITRIDRLKQLEIDTLEHRRLIYDLCTCFKIIHGYNDTCLDMNRMHLEGRPNNTRGHNLKLAKEMCRTDMLRFFFCNRICTVWNSLPLDVVNAPSVNSFKKRVSKFNLDRFLTLK